jgi:hypothetical protein
VVIFLQLPPDCRDPSLKFLKDGSELRISYTWSDEFSAAVENITNKVSTPGGFAMVISLNAYIAQLKEEMRSKKLIGFVNVTLPFECEENLDYASVRQVGPTIIQIILPKKLNKNTNLSFGLTKNNY